MTEVIDPTDDVNLMVDSFVRSIQDTMSKQHVDTILSVLGGGLPISDVKDEIPLNALQELKDDLRKAKRRNKG